MNIAIVDTETTGLNPRTCQTLSIGAVFYRDWNLIDAFYIECLPHDTEYVGEPYALKLNEHLMESAKKTGVREWEAFKRLKTWLDCRTKNVGGKNFGAFDKNFLERPVGPNGDRMIYNLRHRISDPGNRFAVREDDELPDLKTVLERCGLRGKVKHHALHDALVTGEVLKYSYTSTFSFEDRDVANWGIKATDM